MNDTNMQTVRLGPGAQAASGLLTLSALSMGASDTGSGQRRSISRDERQERRKKAKAAKAARRKNR